MQEKKKLGEKKRGEIFCGGKKSSENRKVSEVKQFKNVKKKTDSFLFSFLQSVLALSTVQLIDGILN